MTSQRHFFARGAARLAVAVAGLALAATATTADAQDAVGRFTITTRAGGINFERAASLDNSFLIGVDAQYGLAKYFALGTSLNVTRPNTHAADFLRTITYGQPTVGGDTTYFYEVGQAVNLVEAGLTGVARVPVGRVTPYVTGGVGLYGAFLDAQKNNGSRRFGGMSTQLGAGLALRLSTRAGVQIEARDVMLHDYRAGRLDPSSGRNQNAIFPEDFVAPPTRKNTVNSIGYTLGFRYLPVFLNPTTGDPDDRILNPNGSSK